MGESKYKIVIDKFLEKKTTVTQFIESFIVEWKTDRDNNINYSDRFQRLIDRLFTSCDSYHESPDNDFEITEKQLRQEVSLLRHIWFG